MRSLRAIVCVFVLVCCSVCSWAQGGYSNQGTEFWTAYMDHVDGAAPTPGSIIGSQMSLYITADATTTVNVEVADGSFSQTYTVAGRNILTVSIPPSAFLGDFQGQFMKGIHITSAKPIAVYAHIYARSVSGATLLLPVSTLGKDYTSINFTQKSNSLNGNNQERKVSYSTFNIIGIEDNTTVEITPADNLLGGQPARVPFIIVLKKGEVYQGLSLNDLTGTRIKATNTLDGSCKKVAVFSGSSKIGIGCEPTTLSSDNFFQQVYPTASWGKNYITAPLKNRGYDYFRVVLSDPATIITVNGVDVPQGQVRGGLYYEFTSTTPNIISANKPIQVVQYAVSQGEGLNCTHISDLGDPEMIYLNPIEQTIDHVTLNSTGNFAISQNFINVIIKTATVPTFTLDGRSYTSFTPVTGNPTYSYAQISVSAGVHYISAADGFNAIAYGFGANESYGYSAGTNLKNLNENIVLKDPQNSVTQTNGCTATDYRLQLTLPFKTTSIIWDFKNGVTKTINNPIEVATTVKDGKTLYIYEYPDKSTYPPGDYSVVATVINPVAGECGANEDVEFDFNISAVPVANGIVDVNCFGEPTTFTDATVTGGSDVKSWSWDFGDGQSSAEQNPTHTYGSTGSFNVRLTVTNQNGCTDVSQPITVLIGNKPVAGFNVSQPGCPNNDVVFTDTSIPSAGTITSRQWDFGDGQISTEQNPVHTFAVAKSYDVKLMIINSDGCSNTISKPVVVHDVPLADFKLPDACVNDFVQFTDNSSIADNTESEFTYDWNFGDDQASAANNTSAQKNPAHKYSRADNYLVTLTVHSKYGCDMSVTKTFTVNGGIPKADVTQPAELCSNSEVIFVNHSSVNFGNITRLVVKYDAADNASVIEYMHPVDGQLLSYTYPFFTDGNHSFNVHVEAYSGTECFDIKDYTVVVKPTHIITFAQVPAVCPENDPFQLKPLTLQGPAGTGVYSGTGVSSAGLFNPAQAGPGTFDINYTYATNNSCPVTVSQQITVYPSPTVTAGDDVRILEGDHITLKPTASGHNITYKWIPSTGLDHDDIANPVASPAETTTYKLVVTSEETCAAMSEVTVNVLKYPVIPNAFTPNGDGVNDAWQIKYLATYPGNTVNIFNRYGQKLFSSIGYEVPWDGTYRGAAVPPGVYYYIINPKNGRKVISGNVTIIK